MVQNQFKLGPFNSYFFFGGGAGGGVLGITLVGVGRLRVSFCPGLDDGLGVGLE